MLTSLYQLLFQQRSLHLKTIQVYKILYYFPSGFFTLQPSYSSRLACSDSLLCPFAKTIIPFIPNYIRSWNLSEERVNLTSLKGFWDFCTFSYLIILGVYSTSLLLLYILCYRGFSSRYVCDVNV